VKIEPRNKAGALEVLFHPRAIAVVGASGRPDSPYARPLQYLRTVGFTGNVYPVNRRYAHIDGQRCYPSLSEIPGPVDLVMALVAAAQAVDIVRQAPTVGAGLVLVCSSGFSETGTEGEALQRRLLLAARESDVRVVGPNSQGLFHLDSSLAATFTGAAAVGFPQSGGAAYVGQSGAVGGVVLDLARESGMGLTAWVSTGNDIDVTAQEVACYLVEDPGVRVLMLYLEAMPDGVAYTALAARARQLGKHLVVLRSGRSDAGRRAIASHTGSMVPLDRAFELVSRSMDVILVDDVDELVNVGHALLALPLPAGDRVGIVTTSGGAGALAADACHREGLAVEPMELDSQTALAKLVPAFGAVGNPVDVTVQLLTRLDDSFSKVCRAVAAASTVDSVIVLATSPMGDLGRRLAQQISDVTLAGNKPVLTAWMAGREQTVEGRALFRAAGIPLFDSPGQVARVLAHLASRAATPAFLDAETVAGSLPTVPRLPSGPLLVEAQGLELLDAAGIPRPHAVLVTTPAAASDAVTTFGGTAVMKVQSPRAVHKTDIGGVRIAVSSQEASATFIELASLLADDSEALGVLVQEMVDIGVELVLGVTNSPSGFPPVLTVGFGGIATEIYADVASVALPVDQATARRALLSLRAAPLLTGYRGRPALDVEAAVNAVVRLGALALALGQTLIELEVNPLIVSESGVHAVDFLLRLTPQVSHHG